MADVGIFYGSTTGNTENVARKIHASFDAGKTNLYNIASASQGDATSYKYLILGISTWGQGEMQDDWEEFSSQLENIDLSGKKVALFGLGDQEGYPESFVDAMGTLYSILIGKGAVVVGKWPLAGYSFKVSKAIVDNNFVGLVIDEDNQPELTDDRVREWVESIRSEFS